METARGVFTFNLGQFVRSDGSIGSFSDVALESTPFSQHVFSDELVTVVSLGAVNAWLQNSGGVYLDLTTASYAGHTNFVDFFGNAGNDYVVGTAAANFLAGGDGADSLYGQGGDDIVVADHADIAWGDVQGGEGNDTLVYSSAEALVLYAAARSFDTVMGGSGNDYLYVSSSTWGAEGVLFIGADGNDSLNGGEGNDFLIGGAGSDTFVGGNGDDFFIVDAGDSWTSISGGRSYSMVADTVVVEGAGGFYFGNLYQQGVEHFFGGDGNDTVYASVTNGDYFHQTSYNRLDGGGGNDYLYGGSGNDIYFWGRGGGYDTFVDKDYGETKGDMISLGEGITAHDVTISNSNGDLIISIAGEGGGRIVARGFATTYGPHDMLFVDDKFYDLNTIKSIAYSGISLASIAPIQASTSGGGGAGDTGGGGGGGGGGGYNPDYHEPPMILDLDGDGFELIAAHKSGIFFDWNGDGIKDETRWAGPDDGILVLDRDGDGNITRADEIAFGEVSGKKEPFVSDLEGLRVFDSNGNGSLDSGDDAFGQFRVWRDANSDAIVDEGELLSLVELGIEAMSLTGWLTRDKSNGKDNVIHATTDVVFADGRTIKAADVLLGYDGKEPSGVQASSAFDASDPSLDHRLMDLRSLTLDGQMLPHIV